MMRSILIAASAVLIFSSPTHAATVSREIQADIATFCEGSNLASPSDKRNCKDRNTAAAKYVLTRKSSAEQSAQKIAAECISSEGDRVEWTVVQICYDTKVSMLRR